MAADQFVSDEKRVQQAVEDLTTTLIAWGERWLMWPGEMSMGSRQDYYDEPPGEQAYVLLVSINTSILEGLTLGEDDDDRPYDELTALLHAKGFTYDLEEEQFLAIYPKDAKEQEVYLTVLRWWWVKRLLSQKVQDLHTEVYDHFGKHPEFLVKIGWRGYEEFLDSVFRNQGFRTELGPGSNDGGVDIRLYRSTMRREQVILVQAKQYQRKPVNLDVVAAIRGLIDAYDAHKGMVVTTSRFSSKCTEARGTHAQKNTPRHFGGRRKMVFGYFTLA